MTLRLGIACHPTHGGSGVVASELALALARRGHEVHVLSYAPPFRLHARSGVYFHEVDVPSYPLFRHPPYAIALASKMAEVAAQHRLDVLHAHYAIPHAISAVLAREIAGLDRELAVITTLHGTDITLIGQEPSYRPATRYALGRSDAVTAVSDFLKHETARTVCDACEIEVLPNFVDTEVYAPRRDEQERERFARADEKLLLHISNFRPVKRVLDVVRVFHRVAHSLPARLVLVGDGPDRAAAEALGRELGCAERMVFLGLVAGASEILPQADAYLLPSAGESFGLSALEALSCGVPVVGARAGGLPEVVRDGKDGILEEVGDTEAMARRLIALLRDDGSWQAASRAAREGARTRFEVAAVLPRYEAVYERVRRRGPKEP